MLRGAGGGGKRGLSFLGFNNLVRESKLGLEALLIKASWPRVLHVQVRNWIFMGSVGDVEWRAADIYSIVAGLLFWVRRVAFFPHSPNGFF